MNSSVKYAGNLGSNVPNTGANYSPMIWKDCDLDNLRSKSIAGCLFERDFTSFKSSTNVNAAEALWDAGFMLFGDAGATVTLGSDPTAAADAWGTVALGSDGDNEGAYMRQVVSPWRLTGPNATASAQTGKFWAEWRMKSSTITDTKHGMFSGFIEDVAASAVIPITAAGVLADKNLVGFHRLEGDGDQLDCVYKADGITAVTVLADALGTGTTPGPLVADTYINVGLTYDPLDATLRYWGNGIQLTTKVIPAAAGTDFPNDINLGFIFGVLNATATTPGTSTIDHVRIAQYSRNH
jgi:hypothetical protein